MTVEDITIPRGRERDSSISSRSNSTKSAVPTPASGLHRVRRSERRAGGGRCSSFVEWPSRVWNGESVEQQTRGPGGRRSHSPAALSSRGMPRLVLVFAFLACLCAQEVLAETCLEPPEEPLRAAQNDGSALRIGVGNWASSRLLSALAKILFTERQAFVDIQLVNMNGSAGLRHIADDKVDVVLEQWTHRQASSYVKYVETDQSVLDAGLLGCHGRNGWYVPSDMFSLESMGRFLISPDSWLGDDALLRQFNNSIVIGDTSWHTSVETEALLAGLKTRWPGADLSSRVAATGDLVAEATSDRSSGKQTMYNLWSPHPLIQQYNLSRVVLPVETQRCVDQAAAYLTSPGHRECDFSSVPLLKLVSPRLKDSHPAAFELIKRLTLSEFQMNEMLDLAFKDGQVSSQSDSRIQQAACAFLKVGDGKWWHDWLPPVPPPIFIQTLQVIRPSLGLAHSNVVLPGDEITVTGFNFPNTVISNLLLCKVGGQVTSARFITSKKITCHMPSARDDILVQTDGILVGARAKVSVHVSADAGQTWSDGFSVDADITWGSSVTPTSVNSINMPPVIRIGMLARGHRPQVSPVVSRGSTTFGQLLVGAVDTGEGADLEMAAALAVEEINNSTTLFPFTRLELFLQYTGEDDVLSSAVLASNIMASSSGDELETRASKEGLGQLVILGRENEEKKQTDTPLMLGIVGAQYSSTSIAVSDSVASRHKMPLLTYCSTSPLLSQTSEHPFFMRLCGSDSVQGPVVANMLAHFKWSRVLVVVDASEYSKGLQISFESASLKLGISFEIAPVLNSDNSNAVVSHLKSSRLSIFVALVQSMHVDALLSAAALAGLMEDDNCWLGTDTFSPLYKTLSQSQIGYMSHAVLYTMPPLQNNDLAYNALVSRWRQRYGRNSELPRTFQSVLVYDAVNMMASAGQDLLSKTATIFDSVPPSATAASSWRCSVTVKGQPCVGKCNSSGVCAVLSSMTNNTQYGECVTLDSEDDDDNCPVAILVKPVYRGCRVWPEDLSSGVLLFVVIIVSLSVTVALRHHIGIKKKQEKNHSHIYIGGLLGLVGISVGVMVLLPNVFENSCVSENRGGMPSCLSNSTLVPVFFPLNDSEARSVELLLGPANTVRRVMNGTTDLFGVQWLSSLENTAVNDRLEIEDIKQRNGVTVVYLQGSLAFEAPISAGEGHGRGHACSQLQWPVITSSNPNETCGITVQGQPCITPFSRFGQRVPEGSCENSSGVPQCPTSYSSHFRGGKYFGWRECVVKKEHESECPGVLAVKREHVLAKLRSYQPLEPFSGVGGDYSFQPGINDPYDPTFQIMGLRSVRNMAEPYAIGFGTASKVTLDSSSGNIFKTAATPPGYSSDSTLPKKVRILLVSNQISHTQKSSGNGKLKIELGASFFLNTSASEMLPFTQVFASEVLHPDDDLTTILKLIRDGDDGAADSTPVVAVIADCYSSQAIRLSRDLQPFGMPVFSSISSSPTLSDAQQFPFFSRVVASDLYQASTVAELAVHFKWSSICPLYRMDEDYSKQLSQAFISAATRLGISISELCPIGMTHDESSIKRAVSLMKASKSMVFYAPVYPEDVEMLWTQSDTVGLLAPDVVWLGTDSWLESIFQTPGYPKSATFMSTQFSMPTKQFWDRFKTYHTTGFQNLNRRSSFASGIAHSHDACQLAVTSLDLAFREAGPSSAPCDSRCLRRALNKKRSAVSFIGATGLVQLGGNDRVNPTYSVLDAANASLAVVGSSSPGVEIALQACLLGLPPCCPALSAPLNSSYCQCISPGNDARVPRGAFRTDRGSDAPCYACPRGAMCTGGILYPIQGWWRSSEVATLSRPDALQSQLNPSKPLFNESSIQSSIIVLSYDPETLVGQIILVGDIVVPVRWIKVNPDVPSGERRIVLIAGVYPQVGGQVLLEDNSSFANPESASRLWFAHEAQLTICPVESSCLGWPYHLENAGCSSSTHGRLCAHCNQEQALSGIYRQFDPDGRCTDCSAEAWFWVFLGYLFLHFAVIVYYKSMVFAIDFAGLATENTAQSEDIEHQKIRTREQLGIGASLKLLCNTVQLFSIVFQVVEVRFADLPSSAFQWFNPDVDGIQSRCLASQLGWDWDANFQWSLTAGLIFWLSLLPVWEWVCFGKRVRQPPTLEEVLAQDSASLSARAFSLGRSFSRASTRNFHNADDHDQHPLLSFMFVVRSEGHVCVFIDDICQALECQLISEVSSGTKVKSILNALPRNADVQERLTSRLAASRPEGAGLVQLNDIDIVEWRALRENQPTVYDEIMEKLNETRWVRQQALISFELLLGKGWDGFKQPFSFDEDAAGAAGISIPNQRVHHFLHLYASSEQAGQLDTSDLLLLQNVVGEFCNDSRTTFIEFCTLLRLVCTAAPAPNDQRSSYRSLLDQISTLIVHAQAYRQKTSQDHVFHGVNVVLMFLHPTMFRACLRLLICQDIEGHHYVATDSSQECSGAKYEMFSILATFVMVVYCVGIPIYLAVSIFTKLHKTDAKRKLPKSSLTYRTIDRAINRFGFLFRYYPKKDAAALLSAAANDSITMGFCWWWDLFVASRNAVLIALTATVNVSAHRNSFLGISLALSALLLVHTKPYGSENLISQTLNALDSAACFCCVPFVLFGEYSSDDDSSWTALVSSFTGLLSTFFIVTVLLFIVAQLLYFRIKLCVKANGSGSSTEDTQTVMAEASTANELCAEPCEGLELMTSRSNEIEQDEHHVSSLLDDTEYPDSLTQDNQKERHRMKARYSVSSTGPSMSGEMDEMEDVGSADAGDRPKLMDSVAPRSPGDGALLDGVKL